jgi:hypothetical protein
MQVKYSHKKLAVVLVAAVMLSCQKKQIEFGDDPENNYTRLVYIDTVAVRLSTIITDSFPTGGATSFLLGKYNDPYLGIVSAKPFFQLSPVSDAVDIPSTAVFDSLVFIIRTSDYYYGDTSRAQTISVHELAQAISYSYNDQLYNTSNVNIKPVPLGSRTLKIAPVATDSIIIRLNNTKGFELFDKLRQRSTDVTNADNFLNYFRGICLSVGANDTTAVYGLNGNASMAMRVVYHLTTPAVENKYVDFTFNANTYAFNQVLTDRTGTGLPSSVNTLTEIPSAQTGNLGFTQTGTGLLLKMTFPSLRDIIKNDDIVKLLKADLLVRPAYLSFDRYIHKLPGSLYLAVTDGSNIIGDVLADSSGAAQYAAPYIDAIYGEDSHYRFNVTSYINQLLTTAGTTDYGLFLLEDWSASAMQVNRAVINDANRTKYKTQLVLSVAIINK